MFNPERGYPTVVPYVRYSDPVAAIAWLSRVLGATEAIRLTLPDGRVGHAELRVGSGAVVAVGLTAGHEPTNPPAAREAVRAMTLVFVPDVDKAVQAAVDEGGQLVDAPVEQPWGLRQAIVADREGNVWELTSHTADVPAPQWGAQPVGPWFE